MIWLLDSDITVEGYTYEWMPVQVSADDWTAARDLWIQRNKIGRPIEDADLLIAVSALKAGATLVTNNERHFEGLGLTIENWAAE